MLSNRYSQRRVAEKDARGCFVCYKPTTCVLANDSDFLYACETHLGDRGFATLDPASQRAEEERLRVQDEIARLKAEWEAKNAKKDPKTEANKDTKKDSNIDEKGIKDDSPTQSTDEELKKKNELVTRPQLPDPIPVGPKWYELHPSVLSLRVATKRRAAQERRVREMLASPGLFPEVPKNVP